MVVRFILAYLKGSMTDDQRKEFGEWLGLDERNQKLFERLQDVDYVEG